MSVRCFECHQRLRSRSRSWQIFFRDLHTNATHIQSFIGIFPSPVKIRVREVQILLSKPKKNPFFNITASGTTNQQSQQPPQAAQPQTTSSSSTSTATTSQAAPKRKRSVNPQSDENFQRALEAVRFGGIGFCKAARMYGCNNRTLWLEYKKRGYPISRPSIKNRIKLEPNMTPPPASPTPTNEENTSMENYEHNMTPAQQSTINMSTVPPPAETPTSIMCPPHAHPAMGVMSFLDTSRTTHVSFEPHPTTLQRQRYPDGVNVNPTAINLQGLNFNSM